MWPILLEHMCMGQGNSCVPMHPSRVCPCPQFISLCKLLQVYIIVQVIGVNPPLPSSTISDVMFTEMNNNNGTCINSTLTFTGNLKGLNNKLINCTTGLEERKTSYTIIIPSKQVILHSIYHEQYKLCVHAQHTYYVQCMCLSVSLI